ncbi:hypothetical protein GQX73_g9013 [Xylaria multiplex]|uniref:Uncharacterized protein n=1 Tax=Xylaria multiplex TaxID=323545 RepID=A0A7C8IRA8_9PEZI|nr:hypothetical protein GQX73_g9013 [Xylaria multiplex]
MELRLPEEGLEVAARNQRRSQPGLIVVAGPRVVSPEEKFRSLEPIVGYSEPNQRHDLTSKLEPIQRDVDPPRESGCAQRDSLVSEPEKKILGLRRRTFYFLLAIAILALAGVIIGVAVAVTQHHMVRSTSLPASSGRNVSSTSLSMPPPTTTETVALYVTSDSSSFVTLLKTEIPSSFRRASKTTTATGGRMTEDSEPISVATVFVTKLPSPTDSIRSQPATTVSSSAPPPPKNTSPSSASPPSPPSSPLPTQSSPSSRICIGDDGSTYTDPDTGDKFRLECTVAHQGKDIVNLEANTMQSCINMCAKNTHCKGAIWYNVGPQGTDLNYCWLKSEMDDSDVRITPDAQSVVRL